MKNETYRIYILSLISSKGIYQDKTDFPKHKLSPSKYVQNLNKRLKSITIPFNKRPTSIKVEGQIEYKYHDAGLFRQHTESSEDHTEPHTLLVAGRPRNNGRCFTMVYLLGQEGSVAEMRWLIIFSFTFQFGC